MKNGMFATSVVILGSLLVSGVQKPAAAQVSGSDILCGLWSPASSDFTANISYSQAMSGGSSLPGSAYGYTTSGQLSCGCYADEKDYPEAAFGASITTYIENWVGTTTETTSASASVEADGYVDYYFGGVTSTLTLSTGSSSSVTVNGTQQNPEGTPYSNTATATVSVTLSPGAMMYYTGSCSGSANIGC